MLDLGDSTDGSFLDKPASFFNGQTIKGCFYQQYFLDVDVFPPDAVDVTFVRSNLDNCKIPPGYTIGERCTNDRIRVQHDDIQPQDWFLDSSNNPVSLVNPRKDGGNEDPTKIPLKSFATEKMTRERFNELFVSRTKVSPVFKRTPQIIGSRSHKNNRGNEVEILEVRGTRILFIDRNGVQYGD